MNVVNYYILSTISAFSVSRSYVYPSRTPYLFNITVNKDIIVPRARAEEDLNVRDLLRRAHSAGPVSPTCFDV
jgi:hypothetical protein